MEFLPFMKENVFGPLSMMATVPEFNDVIIPRRSRYVVSGTKLYTINNQMSL